MSQRAAASQPHRLVTPVIHAIPSAPAPNRALPIEASSRTTRGLGAGPALDTQEKPARIIDASGLPPTSGQLPMGREANLGGGLSRHELPVDSGAQRSGAEAAESGGGGGGDGARHEGSDDARRGCNDRHGTMTSGPRGQDATHQVQGLHQISHPTSHPTSHPSSHPTSQAEALTSTEAPVRSLQPHPIR